MSGMFFGASDFDQNLGWCVAPSVNFGTGPSCTFPNCGVRTCFTTKADLVTAVNLWTGGAATTYGDISTWDVSAVDDMAELFRNKPSFNDDISSWDARRAASEPTTLRRRGFR